MTLIESMLGVDKNGSGELSSYSLKMVSWNMRGLFLNAFHGGILAARKMGELQRLCEGHSVVVVQEAHGVEADLTTLDKDIPSHAAFGTFTSRVGAGGCLVLVARKLLRRAEGIASWKC